MATVRDLIGRKGTDVISLAPDATVLAAAQLMNERGVGAVLVVGSNGELLGIFTERDVLRRVVAVGRSPADTPVRDVLSADVVTCVPDTSVDECGAIMTNRRIRHLPVVDDHGLHGLVSIGDVLAHRVNEQEATIRYLNSYMFDVR